MALNLAQTVLPTLPVIRTLGGCGGTLVSRLFGALPRTIVLSETNPRSVNLFGGHLNPLAQLRRWRPALLEDVAYFDDAEIGYPPRFGEMLDGVRTAALRYGYQLIVRDFSYVDFIGVPFLWPPAADCSLDLAVEGRQQIRELLIVRNPADQLASLRTHSSITFTLSAERFIEGSLKFLDDRASAPRFHYEDLVAKPEATFRGMCAALAVEFDPVALTDFSAVTTVTGNMARSSEQAIAQRERSPEAAKAEAELSVHSDYGKLLLRLGYRASEGRKSP